MVSLTKLLRITQGIGKKYKNIGLEKFQSLIVLFKLQKIPKIEQQNAPSLLKFYLIFKP
jgi:hypothetical protein